MWTRAFPRVGSVPVTLAVAALALTAACSPAPPPTAGAPAVASPSAAPSAAPSAGATSVATTSAAAAMGDRLRPGITAAMAELLVPGAVVLVETPEGRWTEAFGTRRLDADEPVTVEDHFRVGSNTKTMTGTVILQLVHEGALALEDPVSMYRPEVPNGENITIGQLMSMTSGLDSYTFLVPFEKALDDDPLKAWDPEELARMGEQLPPKFAPGTGFLYSNTNTVLLGLIIEQLTGTALPEVFAERIFTPLGLDDTSFPALTDNTIPWPHPQGYLFGTNEQTTTTSVLPQEQQAAAQSGELQPNDVTELNPSWGWAAGAAISTASDLATYVQALVGGGLLDPSLQATRLASVQPAEPGEQALSYGLALARFGPMLGHDGALPGYQSFMGYDPTTSTTLVVLTNLQSAPDGRSTANEIAKPIIGVLAEG